jgi:zinc transporter, ZIP family
MQAMQVFWLGVLASALAGATTVIGAAGIFLVRKPSARTQDAMLSAAAGVMLAATFFSLLQPAIENAQRLPVSKPIAVIIVIAGMLSGMIMMMVVHRHAPHEHFVLGREGPLDVKLRRMWLFVIAIALHNFPEGMAVGVGSAGTEFRKGLPLAMGIGIQNIPEGFAVSLSMVAAGYARSSAFAVGSLTGLIEPLGGAFGSAAAWLAEPMMPWILGLAAGAMLFIISNEVIPETHRGGNADTATVSLMLGFVVMMFLDTVFA